METHERSRKGDHGIQGATVNLLAVVGFLFLIAIGTSAVTETPVLTENLK